MRIKFNVLDVDASKRSRLIVTANKNEIALTKRQNIKSCTVHGLISIALTVNKMASYEERILEFLKRSS